MTCQLLTSAADPVDRPSWGDGAHDARAGEHDGGRARAHYQQPFPRGQRGVRGGGGGVVALLAAVAAAASAAVVVVVVRQGQDGQADQDEEDHLAGLQCQEKEGGASLMYTVKPG